MKLDIWIILVALNTVYGEDQISFVGLLHPDVMLDNPGPVGRYKRSFEFFERKGGGKGGKGTTTTTTTPTTTSMSSSTSTSSTTTTTTTTPSTTSTTTTLTKEAPQAQNNGTGGDTPFIRCLKEYKNDVAKDADYKKLVDEVIQRNEPREVTYWRLSIKTNSWILKNSICKDRAKEKEKLKKVEKCDQVDHDNTHLGFAPMIEVIREINQHKEKTCNVDGLLTRYKNIARYLEQVEKFCQNEIDEYINTQVTFMESFGKDEPKVDSQLFCTLYSCPTVALDRPEGKDIIETRWWNDAKAVVQNFARKTYYTMLIFMDEYQKARSSGPNKPQNYYHDKITACDKLE